MSDHVEAATPAAPSSVSASSGWRWGQRAGFFIVGIVMTKVAATFADHLPGPDGFEELGILGAVGVTLVVLNICRGPQWRWLPYAAGVACVWVASVAFLFVPSGVEDWLRARTFDSEDWKAAELGRGETRVWMVDDLLRRPLVGMKASDVDDLLGKDDSVRGTGWGRGYWDDWDRVWWLGPERGFIRIDSEWLVLRIDAAGAVSEAKLVRD